VSKIDELKVIKPEKKKHKAINKETHKLIYKVMQKSIPLNRKKNFIAIASQDVSISEEPERKVKQMDLFNSLQKSYRVEINDGKHIEKALILGQKLCDEVMRSQLAPIT